MRRRAQVQVLAWTVLISTIFVTPTWAGAVLIAHPDVPSDALRLDTVKKVFLGKTTESGGQPVTFAVLADGEVHDSFIRGVIGRSPSQFLNYWRKLAFSGRGSLPTVLADEAAMVAFVESTKGAIGYVSEDAPVSTAKVVELESKE